MKRIVLLLQFCLMVSSQTLFAEEAFWTYTETNTVQNGTSHGYITDNVWTFYASRANGSEKELTVDASKGVSIDPKEPAKIDFTKINDGFKVVAFCGWRNVLSPLRQYATEFIAPDCTTFGGEEAFYQNINLRRVVFCEKEPLKISANVNKCFDGCTSLVDFRPRKIKGVLGSMFLNCSNLEGRFEIEGTPGVNGGTTIGAFSGCAKLGEIKLEKVDTFSQSAFSGCTSLSNIVYDTPIAYIGNYAFLNCTKITTEFVQGLLHKGLKRLGNKADDRKGCFMNCTGLTGSLVWNLPNLITNAVPDDCFSGCTSLERVEIKSPVSVIGVKAFNNLKPGAEIFLHNTPAESYGNFAIATVEAPFPKVYINKDYSDAWLDCMYVAGQNHLMKKNEFTDTSWVSKNGKKYTDIKVIMNKDSTMCNEMVVDNRNVLAFLMSDNKAGCWILKKPEEGFKVIVR